MDNQISDFPSRALGLYSRAPFAAELEPISVLYQSNLAGLELVHRGKVRDSYRIDDDHMLIVATDRLSAFDVVLPQPIPGKGEVLTGWRISGSPAPGTSSPTTSPGSPVAAVVTDAAERAALGQRGTVVRRLKALPVEAIVRGYLIGSGWKDYQKTGAVCGIALPAGLRQADRLPDAIYTPSTKADAGAHDENVDFAHTVGLLGRDLAGQVRDAALRLYTECAAYALTRGIIIADTKFEFGLDAEGRLHLIDEVLTPDSSRFWPADQYQPGIQPAEFRQAVRARLSGDPGLGQDPARPRVAPGHHRPDRGEVSRGGAAPDRERLRWGARHPRLGCAEAIQPDLPWAWDRARQCPSAVSASHLIAGESRCPASSAVRPCVCSPCWRRFLGPSWSLASSICWG